MAGAPTTIYRREGTLLIPGTCAVYCAGPITRSCWGKGEPSVARPSEPLFGGAAPVGGTCPGSHPEIRCIATTLQSSYIRFSLGQSSGFLPRRGSFTCTSAASLCPGAPSGNGPQTNRRCLVDFVPTYLHLPPPSRTSRPHSLSCPPPLLSCLSLSLYDTLLYGWLTNFHLQWSVTLRAQVPAPLPYAAPTYDSKRDRHILYRVLAFSTLPLLTFH